MSGVTGQPAPGAAVGVASTGTEPGRPLLEITDLRMYFPISSGILISRHVGDVRAVDGVTLAIQKDRIR